MLKSLATKSVKRGSNVRAAVRNLTLKALQQRELTLDQIGRVLRSVTEGVTLGVAKREIKVEKALSDTVAGMDDALLKAVQASKVALHRLTGTDYDYEDSNLKQALDELERFEDALLQSIAQATQTAGERIRAPWERVLEKTKQSGTATGTQVASTVRDYAKRAQAAMREQRETGFKTAHLLTQNFAILTSGILIGMSEGLEGKPVAVGRKPKSATGGATTKATRSATAKTAKRATAKTAKRTTAKTAKRATAKTAKRPKTVKRAKATTARKSR
ncbi:MAG: hypothetical protein IT521_13855 [Burkholderiales bacterium]|nr:hypothetical protein [Burkholderiales bacterium]